MDELAQWKLLAEELQEKSNRLERMVCVLADAMYLKSHQMSADQLSVVTDALQLREDSCKDPIKHRNSLIFGLENSINIKRIEIDHLENQIRTLKGQT